jgi:hypothetical protein
MKIFSRIVVGNTESRVPQSFFSFRTHQFCDLRLRQVEKPG